jgi:hypothetical protein
MTIAFDFLQASSNGIPSSSEISFADLSFMILHYLAIAAAVTG